MTRVPFPRRELQDEQSDQPMALDLGVVSWPAPSTNAATAPPIEATARPEPPLHCRLRLWHHYRMVHTPGVDAYAACSECGQLAPMTIFEPVVRTH